MEEVLPIIALKLNYMKQTVLRYGTYSSIFLIVFFVITWLIWGNAVEKDFKIQEVLGYLAIFLATLFAFLV